MALTESAKEGNRYYRLDGNEEFKCSLHALERRLDSFFEISKRGSTIKTELWAGLILYAAMCYIIVVNPEILQAASIDKGHTAMATIISGMVCTLFFSLYANLPFGSAPGMGLNTLFAYELVKQNGFSPQQALSCCFVAGVFLLVLSLLGICTQIVNAIPLSLKKAVVVGLGLFQTIIGLSSIGIIQQGKYTILEMGDMNSFSKWMAVATLLFIALLLLLDIPGSILIGICVSMCFVYFFGFLTHPHRIFSVPSIETLGFDFSILRTQNGAFSTVSIFLIAFMDAGGVMVGLAAQGASLLDADGNVINSTRAYISLSLGVILASCLGTSPMVIFLESAAAISQGGRTGLTSLAGGILMGLSAFFIPIIRVVPTCAISPVLVIVGSFMMGAVLAIPWDQINHALPAFITVSMIVFTCSISHGIIAGSNECCVIILQISGWRWLTNRLAVVENHAVAVDKMLSIQRSIERKRETFSLRNENLDIDTLRESTRQSGATTGWI